MHQCILSAENHTRKHSPGRYHGRKYRGEQKTRGTSIQWILAPRHTCDFSADSRATPWPLRLQGSSKHNRDPHPQRE